MVGTVVVRGEIMMKKSSLEKINKIQASLGKDLFTNTRNSTVGILRTPRHIHLAEFLSFKAFDIKVA